MLCWVSRFCMISRVVRKKEKMRLENFSKKYSIENVEPRKYSKNQEDLVFLPG